MAVDSSQAMKRLCEVARSVWRIVFFPSLRTFDQEFKSVQLRLSREQIFAGIPMVGPGASKRTANEVSTLLIDKQIDLMNWLGTDSATKFKKALRDRPLEH